MNASFAAEVVSIERLSPSVVRIELGGGDIAQFTSTGFADEWVRLVFPNACGDIALPGQVDGKWGTPEGVPKSPMRPYTVRRWDADRARMTVDFVVHDGGVAASWAAGADVGDRIGIANPDGRFRPPVDAEWILLLADITGLPAVGRIVEETPPTLRTFAHLEVAVAGDEQPHITAAAAVARWHTGFGATPEITRLAEIARSIDLPKGQGYIWIAGEAQAVTGAREHFRDRIGFDKDRITAIGYWFLGKPRG
ncbi:NADPH-dependent ferric siderophore reductase [Ensifer adhaerens]|uniref:NADPH-dependent ferric siderophore reductase n=1 Tax=Ensifer adhaerens TaxID=106592 RepID=A0ACC5T4L0_ENSAD|nr:siderophore-interacting protein [Ensifer adhaerens]MBP1876047.1 NADPH-dependent ferric siderophore reductase [Ensifer adhaerens]